jgi:hypothetical protein
MKPSLTYYVSSVVHLQLEDFHNAGLTPEQTKEAIESALGTTGFCEASGVNRNWNVHTLSTDRGSVGLMVLAIEQRRRALLETQKNQTPK